MGAMLGNLHITYICEAVEALNAIAAIWGLVTAKLVPAKNTSKTTQNFPSKHHLYQK